MIGIEILLNNISVFSVKQNISGAIIPYKSPQIYLLKGLGSLEDLTVKCSSDDNTEFDFEIKEIKITFDDGVPVMQLIIQFKL